MVASNGTENGSGVAPTAPANNFSAIPGPLGIESASVRGKVALVTGSGK
jgi:hypothetical protein